MPNDFPHGGVRLFPQDAWPNRHVRRLFQFLQYGAVPCGQQFRKDVHLADAMGNGGGHLVFRRSRASVQNQRNVRDCGDFVQAFNIQFRGFDINAMRRPERQL